MSSIFHVVGSDCLYAPALALIRCRERLGALGCSEMTRTLRRSLRDASRRAGRLCDAGARIDAIVRLLVEQRNNSIQLESVVVATSMCWSNSDSRRRRSVSLPVVARRYGRSRWATELPQATDTSRQSGIIAQRRRRGLVERAGGRSQDCGHVGNRARTSCLTLRCSRRAAHHRLGMLHRFRRRCIRAGAHATSAVDSQRALARAARG